jgi:hypothetical protein
VFAMMMMMIGVVVVAAKRMSVRFRFLSEIRWYLLDLDL